MHARLRARNKSGAGAFSAPASCFLLAFFSSMRAAVQRDSCQSDSSPDALSHQLGVERRLQRTRHLPRVSCLRIAGMNARKRSRRFVGSLAPEKENQGCSNDAYQHEQASRPRRRCPMRSKKSEIKDRIVRSVLGAFSPGETKTFFSLPCFTISNTTRQLEHVIRLFAFLLSGLCFFFKTS